VDVQAVFLTGEGGFAYFKQDSLLQKMSIKWNKEQNIVKTGEGRWQKFD